MTPGMTRRAEPVQWRGERPAPRTGSTSSQPAPGSQSFFGTGKQPPLHFVWLDEKYRLSSHLPMSSSQASCLEDAVTALATSQPVEDGTVANLHPPSASFKPEVSVSVTGRDFQEDSKAATFEALNLRPALPTNGELPEHSVYFPPDEPRDSESGQIAVLEELEHAPEYDKAFLKIERIDFQDMNLVWRAIYSRIGALSKDPCATVLRKFIDAIENRRDSDPGAPNSHVGKKFHCPSWWPIGQIEWRVPTRLRVEDKKAMIAYIYMLPHWDTKVVPETLRRSHTEKWSEILEDGLRQAENSPPFKQSSDHLPTPTSDSQGRSPLKADEDKNAYPYQAALGLLRELLKITDVIQHVAEGRVDPSQSCGLNPVPESLCRVMYGRGKPRNKGKSEPGAPAIKRDQQSYRGGPGNWPRGSVADYDIEEDPADTDTDEQEEELSSPATPQTGSRKRRANSPSAQTKENQDNQQTRGGHMESPAYRKRVKTNKNSYVHRGQPGTGHVYESPSWNPGSFSIRADPCQTFDPATFDTKGDDSDDTATEPDDDLAAEIELSRRDSLNHPAAQLAAPYLDFCGATQDDSFIATSAANSFSMGMYNVTSSAMSRSFASCGDSAMHDGGVDDPFGGFLPHVSQNTFGYNNNGLSDGQPGQTPLFSGFSASSHSRPSPALQTQFGAGFNNLQGVNVYPQTTGGKDAHTQESKDLPSSSPSTGTILSPSSQNVSQGPGHAYQDSWSAIEFASHHGGLQRQALGWDSGQCKSIEECGCGGPSNNLQHGMGLQSTSGLHAPLPLMTGNMAYCAPPVGWTFADGRSTQSAVGGHVQKRS